MTIDLKQAVVFGDSILRGLTRNEDGSRRIWKNPWISRIREESGWELSNHSQIGCTVERGAMLLEKAVSNGMEAEAVLLEYGGNDSDYDWDAVSAAPAEEHFCKTPPQRFTECFSNIIRRCRELGMQVLLMDLPPISFRDYFSWISRARNGEAIKSWLGNIQRLYRWQEYYSLMVTRLAEEEHCPLIRVREGFLSAALSPALMSMDGIHPSDEGYEMIWQKIAAAFSGFCAGEK